MRTLIRNRVAIGTLSIIFGLSPSLAAQDDKPPLLWWSLNIEEGLQAENGLTFDVFGERSELSFQLTLRNRDSEHSIALPSEFVERLRFAWREGNQHIPIDVDWRTAEAVIENDPIPVGVAVPIVLNRGDRLVLSGVVT